MSAGFCRDIGSHDYLNNMQCTIEVCVDTLESAIAAEEGGADRIELCSTLIEGGVTPSHGLLQCVCRKIKRARIHVLIRPRGGDFLYSPDEVGVMHHDVLHAAASGAHGVVMGFLTREGDVDVDSTTSFVKLCSALGLDFTFHRAFDVVRNQLTALNSLIACRVPRVLTSGGQPTALQGAEQLAALVAEAGVRISIMPGAGVTEDNAAAIVESTGAREIHGTFRCIKQPSLGMKYVHPVVTFGPRCAGEWGGNGDSGVEDGTQWMIRRVADPAAIAAVRQKLAQLAEVERSMD